MRGSGNTGGWLFSDVGLEGWAPTMPPLRVIKAIVDGALSELDAEVERR